MLRRERQSKGECARQPYEHSPPHVPEQFSELDPFVILFIFFGLEYAKTLALAGYG